MPRRRKSSAAARARPLRSRDLTRGQLDIALMRCIIGFLGTWRGCFRACRRMKGCADPTCACFDLNRENIQEMLTEIAEWPRLDGPREEDVASGPPGALFD